ncbi:hypothetical protein ALC56_05967 [Trachymyrmex septentrionalis]|uniref:Uncharacterized protein n=1 Tax=Trachymyrmex septentrionalis TaxID=34720 RepID=A0A195FHJ2_9HYME|nr:hypothetical protein ALC56_05967 [Trachymyrmex septentrionalis]
MCIHIRHSLAIPPIPPSAYRKRVYPSISAKKKYTRFRIAGACAGVASWRHVPAARFSRVGGYRFGAVDVVRPREWSDDRLRSVKRVGGLGTTKLDKARPTARSAAHPQRGHKIRHPKQILL